jgi:hypothetical protein
LLTILAWLTVELLWLLPVSVSWLHTRLHAWLHAWLHILHARLHTWLHTRLHAWLHAWLHILPARLHAWLWLVAAISILGRAIASLSRLLDARLLLWHISTISAMSLWHTLGLLLGLLLGLVLGLL